MAFTGYSADTFNRNWGPDYRKTDTMPDGDLHTVFRLLPGCYRHDGRANISGSSRTRRSPCRSVPCLLSPLARWLHCYRLILGATCERDGGLGGRSRTHSQDCISGGPLVIVGIFALTILSALPPWSVRPRSSRPSADGLFPPLAYFAKGRAGDNEPIRGYGLTAVIALAGIMIGDLNAIALITNFSLPRALINFACFLASYSQRRWCPSYRCYNRWVARDGDPVRRRHVCHLPVPGAHHLGLGVLLSVYIKRRAPPVNWGAAELGLWLNAKKHLLQLNRVQLAHHVKTWRPILAVPRSSREDSTLISYAQQLSAGSGFTIYADILIGTFHEKSLQSAACATPPPALPMRPRPILLQATRAGRIATCRESPSSRLSALLESMPRKRRRSGDA